MCHQYSKKISLHPEELSFSCRNFRRAVVYCPQSTRLGGNKDHANRYQGGHLHPDPRHRKAEHPAGRGAVQGDERPEERRARDRAGVLRGHRHGGGEDESHPEAHGYPQQAGPGGHRPVRAHVHLRQTVLRVPPYRGPGAPHQQRRGGQSPALQLPEYPLPAPGDGGPAGDQRERHRGHGGDRRGGQRHPGGHRGGERPGGPADPHERHRRALHRRPPEGPSRPADPPGGAPDAGDPGPGRGRGHGAGHRRHGHQAPGRRHVHGGRLRYDHHERLPPRRPVPGGGGEEIGTRFIGKKEASL